ncbi:MAG: PaaI family thioesterase [Pseudomonadota bacterium]
MSEFDPKSFFELARKVGHGQALGLEFRDSGQNWVELALPWKEQLVGVATTGILASGAIVSLLDTCGGASVWQTLGKFQPAVTIDLRLDYLRPALKGETVIARCQVDKMTRQIAFVSGVAHTGDDNRPVARAVGTFMLNP